MIRLLATTSLLAALAALGCAAAPPAPPPAPVSKPVAVAPPAPTKPWHTTPPPEPIAVTQTPDTPAQEQVLANGLRVVVVEHHGRPTVMIRLVLPQGTVGDPPEWAGATYLGVSLATDYYELNDQNEPIYDEKSFRGQLVELGGTAFALAEPDGSVIGVSGLSVNTHRYLSKLAAAVLRPRLGEHSFSARRDALLDELDDLESADPEAFQRVVTASAFGKNHPYSRSTIGTESSLTDMGVEMVLERQKRVLVPGGATLLVVGDVKAEAVFTAVAALFRPWRGRAPPSLPIALPSLARSSGVAVLKRTPAQTLAVCAARPLREGRDAMGTLQVLAAILGRGLGSRLSLNLREQHTLTYSTDAAVARRRYANAFLACATLDAAHAEEGVKLFRETLESAARVPPTPQELERAKALLLQDLAAHRDDAAHITEAWLNAILIDDGRPDFDKQAAAISQVTAEQVQAMARKVLAPDTLAWTMSGDPDVAAKAAAADHLGRSRPVSFER
ncbi:MAG: insulinase family protein [Deltaproteobacteria bacterium]|nr:insulinase family protein [Deltaproteobacteria bacterium]